MLVPGEVISAINSTDELLAEMRDGNRHLSTAEKQQMLAIWCVLSLSILLLPVE